jgi:hypothetical protein
VKTSWVAQWKKRRNERPGNGDALELKALRSRNAQIASPSAIRNRPTRTTVVDKFQVVWQCTTLLRSVFGPLSSSRLTQLTGTRSLHCESPGQSTRRYSFTESSCLSSFSLSLLHVFAQRLFSVPPETDRLSILVPARIPALSFPATTFTSSALAGVCPCSPLPFHPPPTGHSWRIVVTRVADPGHRHTLVQGNTWDPVLPMSSPCPVALPPEDPPRQARR